MLHYNATIYFDTKGNHPDAPNKQGLSFKDTYHIDTDMLWGSPIDYMKRDLMLIAGGGYKTDTIQNVTFYIQKTTA